MLPDALSPAFLTTKEVAELLRVKERKVYDMASAGEIPHRRITGKLLFPRAQLMGWLEGADDAELPAVLTGSHDPLLDWALRESGAALAVLTNGSASGLSAFAAREASLTGLHLPEPDGWNIQTVAQAGLRNAVLIGWAKRTRGLILHPDLQHKIGTVDDLKGRRVVLRQPGAGADALLDRLLGEVGLSRDDLSPAPALARTESDAAAAISAGEADAALGIEAMARQFRLGFLPLMGESYDLLIDRKAYFSEPVQTLLRFSQSAAVRDKAKAMGGYDLTDMGKVRWVSE